MSSVRPTGAVSRRCSCWRRRAATRCWGPSCRHTSTSPGRWARTRGARRPGCRTCGRLGRPCSSSPPSRSASSRSLWSEHPAGAVVNGGTGEAARVVALVGWGREAALQSHSSTAHARELPQKCTFSVVHRPVPWGRALTKALALPGAGSRGFRGG